MKKLLRFLLILSFYFTSQIIIAQTGGNLSVNNTDWKLCLAGGQHSVALKNNGTLWAWGDNTYGQLGDGTNVSTLNPIKIGSDNKWTMIAAGVAHNLALKSNGTLWAWGFNNFGQLGDGSVTGKNCPVQIGNDTTWVSISAGGGYSLGLKSNGTLWAWGGNGKYTLGDGTKVDKHVPVQIGTDSTWQKIAASNYHSLGLKSDGSLWTWGDNTNGQLGDGTTTLKTTPFLIGSNWASIAGGTVHSIGIKTDGSLWAWGGNNNSQLGDGTTSQKKIPTKIGTDSLWNTVTASNYHSFGIKENGTLWGWGANSYGQLGDASNTLRSAPTRIGTDSGWVNISTNTAHSTGIKGDKKLFCVTGFNSTGQLGDNTTNQRNNFECICVAPDAPSTSNTTICIGSTASLTALGQGTISWYSDNATSIYLGNGKNYLTPPLNSTTSFYAKDSTCDKSNYSELIVITEPYPIVTPISSTNTTTICNGISITLNGASTPLNSQMNYAWSGAIMNGISFISNSSITTYTVIGTSTNNCSDTSLITFSFLPSPNVSPISTPSSAAVCLGAPVKLTAAGNANSYKWSGNIVDDVPFIPMISDTYTLTGTGLNGCKKSVIRAVTVINLPNIETIVSPSTTICKGKSLTIDATGAVSYVWPDEIKPGVSFVPKQTITFSVTGENEYSCKKTIERTIVVDSCVDNGITEMGIGQQQLTVYPNPNTGCFSIKKNTTDHANSFGDNYSIVNQLGQTVQEFKLYSSNKFEVNIENLSSGIYFIIGLMEDQTIHQKIIIRK